MADFTHRVRGIIREELGDFARVHLTDSESDSGSLSTQREIRMDPQLETMIRKAKIGTLRGCL